MDRIRQANDPSQQPFRILIKIVERSQFIGKSQVRIDHEEGSWALGEKTLQQGWENNDVNNGQEYRRSHRLDWAELTKESEDTKEVQKRDKNMAKGGARVI